MSILKFCFPGMGHVYFLDLANGSSGSGLGQPEFDPTRIMETRTRPEQIRVDPNPTRIWVDPNLSNPNPTRIFKYKRNEWWKHGSTRFWPEPDPNSDPNSDPTRISSTHTRPEFNSGQMGWPVFDPNPNLPDPYPKIRVGFGFGSSGQV